MILVDTCIILDVMTRDAIWRDWSFEQICKLRSQLYINPIIYAELAARMSSPAELDSLLTDFRRVPISFEAAFLAGQAFIRYKNIEKGTKTSTLSDFFIGAHAVSSKMKLLTRDIRRYQTYFPNVQLIHPYQ